MLDREEQACDDVTLIQRVGAGDRRAFSVLVERHWAPMYRGLLAMMRDRAAAEDALQDAFTSVWKSASTFRGESGGRAWLWAIARNAVNHRFRRQENRPEVFESLDASRNASLDDLGIAAGWGDPSSGDRVHSALEDRERVHKALAALSADDRELVVLVDIEEFSTQEAADALHIGVAALKSRLHRARLRLIAELSKEDSDGG